MSVQNLNIAILASTNGTDLQAVIDERDSGNLEGVEVACVISNKNNCGALKKARAAGIEAIFIDPAGKTKEEYDKEVLEVLYGKDVQLVFLMGYMRILTPLLTKAFTGKIINVHPSLLPKFGGKGFYGSNVHQAVIDAGDKETGMTIHYVSDEVDAGEIILQKKVGVEPGDDAESLKTKVQELEKRWYPEVIRMFRDVEVN